MKSRPSLVGALVRIMACALLWTTPVLAAPTLGPVLENRDLALGYASARNRSDGTFSEGAICRGVLKGGGALYARLAISNVGPADGDVELRLRVSLPGRKAHEVAVRRDGGDWSWDKASFGADLGDARWSTRVKRGSIEASDEQVEMKLSISSRMRPLRPLGLDAPLPRGDFYRTTILIPHGRVEGTIKVRASGEVIRFEGWVHMVHNQMNKMPFNLAESFYSALDVSWRGTVAMWAYKATPDLGGGIRGWLLVTNKGKIPVWEPAVSLRPMDPKRDGATGYGIPRLLHVTAPGSSGLRGVIHGDRLTTRIDDLAGLGSVERFFVERLSKPWSFRHKGRYLFTLPPAEEGGEEALFKGKLVYTYQQLN